MSGTTCAKTFSAPGSGTPTTTSSRPAQPHGAFSSATLNASDQSAIATGRVSVFKRVGIKASSASTASPHPEEHRGAVRLEGWATCLVVAHPSRRALRALLRVRWCGFTFSVHTLGPGRELVAEG